jgi:hypothetical protein
MLRAGTCNCSMCMVHDALSRPRQLRNGQAANVGAVAWALALALAHWAAFLRTSCFQDIARVHPSAQQCQLREALCQFFEVAKHQSYDGGCVGPSRRGCVLGTAARVARSCQRLRVILGWFVGDETRDMTG